METKVRKTSLSLRLALVLTLTACGTAPIPPSTGNSVLTEAGRISGTGDDVHTYRGIPYAAPPTGELRWRPPAPVAPWSGIRDGGTIGPDCPQPSEYPELRGSGMSEDCLRVNVWSPARQGGDKLPVMVWIHGGGFTYGSGSHPSYDGEALARRGVVVVTLNYRLGLLGFMAHPQLTAESATHSSGNYGLLDQVAALKWVQRNIVAFGGDPAKVTVFGQSAGAHSISALLVSPLSQGLFQQAIMQSVGVMRPTATLAEAEAYGASFGPDIRALRDLPSEVLVERLRNAPPQEATMTSARALSIVEDGYAIRTPDRVAFAGGQFSKVRILVGNNENEGGGATRQLSVKTAETFEKYLAQTFPGYERAAQAVFGTSRDSEVGQGLSDLYSDTQFRSGTREMLQADVKYGATAYRYVFSRHRNDAQQAPIHGDELQFVFDNLRAPHRGRMRPFNATDEQVARDMADAWVRFARSGDPGGGSLPAWRPYETTTEPFVEFGTAPHDRQGYDTPRLKLIRDYYTAQGRTR
ncbi:carboxylesterase/lipase family protein [Cupriavidus sp. PET2-C1]